MSNDQIYRQQLLDHYNNPRNFGELSNATDKAMLENTSCGDKVEVTLKVEQEIVKDVKFKGEGCAIAIASASMLIEEIIGKSVDEVKNMKYEDIEEMLGLQLTPSRIKCAHLGLLAIQKALEN